jgi:hypothetical protein
MNVGTRKILSSPTAPRDLLALLWNIFLQDVIEGCKFGTLQLLAWLVSADFGLHCAFSFFLEILSSSCYFWVASSVVSRWIPLIESI